MPQQIINGLLNGLKDLFIPSANYLTNAFTELQFLLSDKFGYDLSFMDSIKGASGKTLDNIDITIMGITATIIDFTFLNNTLVNVRPWIQSLIYLLLLVYNVNQVYRLIRGTSLIDIKMAEVNIHNSMNEGGYGQ